MVFSIDARLELCSPEGIRTLVADLRSQSPRPLDDGAVPVNLFITRTKHIQLYVLSALGYQDSNLDLLNQNQQGCQLPHTPRRRAQEYRRN